jgi:acetolactate synthase I/II/III large subunit
VHDALMDRPGIRVVTTRHESGAMFAAAGYARMTGKLGVVLVTSGPGVLNAVTGLASAHCDGLPVLLLAGEVPRGVFGKGALQEGSAHHLDIVGLCRPISKLSMQIPEANAAPAMMRRAIATSLSGKRGPVVVTLPLDVTSAFIKAPRIAIEGGVTFDPTAAKTGEGVAEVAALLRSAQRPLLFAGSGTRWGDAPRKLRALAERLQIPVMTTPKAKGVFPESHPLALGIFGYGGHPSSTAYLEGGCDVLVAVGTRLSDPSTDNWSKLISPSKAFVQIDIDAMQIGRSYAVTHGLVGDASSLLGALVESTPDLARPPKSFGVRRHEDPAVGSGEGDEERITPQRAIWELQRSLPADAIFTSDIGEHLLYALHYLRIDHADSFLSMIGLGSMGSGVGSALGVKLGKPDRVVAAICGDGCFSMGLGDVATAVKDQVPVLFVVLNDERYGMVEIGHESVYGRKPAYESGPMSVPEMAQSVGAQARVVRRAHELANLDLERLLKKGPVVLDVRIDRSTRMPKNKRNESIASASSRTRSKFVA